MDREDHGIDSTAFAARSRNGLDELGRRLSAEPGVEHIAFADRLPVEDQFKYQIEVDTMLGAPTAGLRRSTLVHVSGGGFAAFGTSVVAGRDFVPLDFETARISSPCAPATRRRSPRDCVRLPPTSIPRSG